MKFTLPLPTDGKVHVYCVTCHADGTKKTRRNGQTVFVCPNGHENARAQFYGIEKKWLAADKELWHASVGVFIRNTAGKFLFFDRTEFPFGLAMPAGHVDEGETPEAAAKRETSEEVHIRIKKLKHIATTDIAGDACSGGADFHRWGIYTLDYHDNASIHVNDEGRNPVWLTLEEALDKELPLPVRHILTRFAGAIEST